MLDVCEKVWILTLLEFASHLLSLLLCRRHHVRPSMHKTVKITELNLMGVACTKLQFGPTISKNTYLLESNALLCIDTSSGKYFLDILGR
jgi:hypothetical protein